MFSSLHPSEPNVCFLYTYGPENLVVLIRKNSVKHISIFPETKFYSFSGFCHGTLVIILQPEQSPCLTLAFCFSASVSLHTVLRTWNAFHIIFPSPDLNLSFKIQRSKTSRKLFMTPQAKSSFLCLYSLQLSPSFVLLCFIL